MSYILAIDQGTTSTRCMIFDRAGKPVGSAQTEHQQLYPQPGWVEHDAEEIWRATQTVIDGALKRASLRAGAITAVGVTNQRETTVVWDKQNRKAGAQCHRVAGHTNELKSAGP